MSYLLYMSLQINIDVERTIKILQQRMLCIFLGEISMLGWEFPIDTKAIIEDADAAICLWVIEVITLVLEYSSL